MKKKEKTYTATEVLEILMRAIDKYFEDLDLSEEAKKQSIFAKISLIANLGMEFVKED